MVRALLAGNVLIDTSVIGVLGQLLLLASLLVLLGDDLGGGLQQLGLGRLELVASLLAAVVDVG